MDTKKVWFVTGASKGLGLSLVNKLLQEGYQVTATSRNKNDILSKTGPNPNLLAMTVDITDETAVKNALDETVSAFGKIDVVVNNAGYMLLGSLEEVSASEFHQSMDVNVYAFLNVIRHAMPYLREQKSGHIVNFSSVAGHLGSGCAGSYNAAKFAIVGLSEALAREVEPLGIKVTIVSPGFFRTSFLEKGGFASAQTMIEGYATHQLIDRMNQINGKQPGNPDKLAAVLMTIVEEENPPLHLLMGQDGYEMVTNNRKMQDAEFEQWKAISFSTNFE